MIGRRLFTKLKSSVQISLATFLALWQIGFALTPLLTTNSVVAANEIDASTHEGQLKPSMAWSGGNITTYQEGDTINFRFVLTSSAAASGQMKVQFTVDDTCKFFDGSFVLGAIESISGSTPIVTTVGSPTDAGSDWEQLLNVSFAGSGSGRVNYTLKLSNEAGKCNGSSQHARLDDVSGGFKNIGNMNVPIPANDVIELPEIFVEKWVDTSGDGTVDRRAAAGEWSFSLDNGTPVATDANGKVTFVNVTPNGAHTITESNGPAGQNFLSGSGTNCTFQGSTATANVASGTTPTNATCIFNNAVAQGQITITKNAVPNNLADFAYTASGTGVSNFTLDDDAGVPGADNTYSNTKTFGNLGAGSYTFTESAVSGWDLQDITCPNATISKNVANRTVTITLAPGQTVSCTFENRQRGNIIVTKQTNPDGDPTQFSVTASGTGTVHGTSTQSVTDNNSVTFVVSHGTYDVNESVPAGWSVDESACQDLVISGNTPLVNGVPTVSCTITNTKLATLTILKDALPNDAQNFEFTVTNLPGGNFLLDDDTDNSLSNTKVFSNLTPGQTYSVTELSVPGWQLTGLSCNNVTRSGSTVSFTPTAGQELSCTFTNTKLGSISGIKYTANADGSTGPVLSGWTVFIDSNNNGILDNDEVSDVTDVTGSYSLLDLLPGSYTLKEVLISGWTQIFGPTENPVVLEAGENSTGHNFGNFQNASISGFKWNDLDGNGLFDNSENKLGNWEMTLYDSQDNQLATTTTNVSGSYSFGNLAPGSYSVCETQQNGWVQTFPASNACHSVVINISGETEQANFGNQGRGSIQVIKNVDTDGDGDIDTSGATDWTWDINNNGNYATGSTQSVAAGTYTISEEQKTDYHVTSSSCSSETVPTTATTSLSATVSAGEAVVCTFVNTRDTGTITVNKSLSPASDAGVFNLNIDSTTYAADASHGGTTGAVTVPTGTHAVSETAGTNTSLSNYSSSFVCDDKVSGDGTNSGSFSVATGENIVCTFTNVRYGSITVEKQTLPDESTVMFEFTASYNTDGFSLGDGQQNNSGDLLPGTYSVSEVVPDGWDLDSAVCSDESSPGSIDLSAGETVTCTFTNMQRASVTVTKYNDLDRDGIFDLDESEVGIPEPTLSGWEFTLEGDEQPDCEGIGCLVCFFLPWLCDSEYNYSEQQTTGGDGTTTFEGVKPYIEHELTETEQDGWTLTNLDCDSEGEQEVGRTEEDGSYYVYASPGEEVQCFAGNAQDLVLNIAKSNDTPNPTQPGSSVIYTLTVSVPQNSGVSYDTVVTDLPPENFEYVPGSWTATSNLNGSLDIPEPTYASPGQWQLGTLLPGEIVTLTYKTIISSLVSSGTYPDLAFAIGYNAPSGGARVLANVSTGSATPFVGTQVVVVKDQPAVLAATTELLNTGQRFVWIDMLLGGSLLAGALALLVRRSQKGAIR